MTQSFLHAELIWHNMKNIFYILITGNIIIWTLNMYWIVFKVIKGYSLNHLLDLVWQKQMKFTLL